ncbi:MULTISPECIES: serpin family protein [unclassified Streptomyces]|uniref:serpin family protein n=1 Tax=unclassified Streptomyces TaxID=2593676 RepID=UPI00369417C7
MTPHPANDHLGRAADAVREWGGRWVERFGARDFVCAPAGLWLALGVVAAGARGRTAAELREVVGAGGEAAAGAVTEVGRRIGEGAAGAAVATGVWSRVPVLGSFRSGLPDVRFGTLPGAAYFALPDTAFGATDDLSFEPGDADAQGEIDTWVRGATGGRIARLPLELDGSEELVLVNAVALKAAWACAFPRRLTRDAPFTDGDGVTRPVPTMHRRVPGAWAWRTGRVTVVELPCAGEGAPRVRFALGPRGAGPSEVIAAAWAGDDGDRAPLGTRAVDVALPRFSLRTRTDVTGDLPALGVTHAVRPGADFSGLSAADLFVSGVAQEALVEIAEEGMEAAAVTQVTTARSAAPPRPEAVERVAFDRPFGMVVLDATGRLPLFAGWRRTAPVA